MSFVIEVEFLLGTCTATRMPADRWADWPVQPDRLFSAMTAARGASGDREAHGQALEWLERLEPPTLWCSEAYRRDVFDSFVPVNDQKTPTKLSEKKLDLGVLPGRRLRQSRTFPTVVPRDSRMFFVWSETIPEELHDPLSELVREIAYLGHSSSLSACRLHAGTTMKDGFDLSLLRECRAHRWVYPGRLKELDEAFSRGARPPSATTLLHENPSAENDVPHRSVYGNDWVVLECADGSRPGLVAAAHIAETLRRAILSAGDESLPEALSGHGADGKPSRKPHMAILTLPFVGATYADGTVHGVGIVMPREQDRAFADALAGAVGEAEKEALETRRHLSAALDYLEEERDGMRFLRLYARERPPFFFSRVPRALSTLRPDRWTRSSRVWASVTPIVLDRHLKTSSGRANGDNERRQQEVSDVIALSCERIGLPPPISVVPAKQSAHVGADPVRSGGPAWNRWQVPERAASRTLSHATIVFDEPVEGPVLLGAGRHYGLGLCAPLDGTDR